MQDKTKKRKQEVGWEGEETLIGMNQISTWVSQG